MFCALASPRRLERQNLCQIQARMLTSPPQETCTHTLTSEQPGRVSHGWAWNPGAEKLSPSSPPQHLGDGLGVRLSGSPGEACSWASPQGLPCRWDAGASGALSPGLTRDR